jgi:hypothetical protein
MDPKQPQIVRLTAALALLLVAFSGTLSMAIEITGDECIYPQAPQSKACQDMVRKYHGNPQYLLSSIRAHLEFRRVAHLDAMLISMCEKHG